MSGADGELAELVARYGLAEAQAARLSVLVERLCADDRAPTTVRDPGEVARTHVADSLAGLELEQVQGAGRVADLGSGAGLPGLVLAVALPEAQVSLVESQSRKCAYIATLVAALELANARVVCARAEEWPEGMGVHDLVVARALAAQPVVMEYAAPLLRVGGWLVEWRGARVGEEERAAALAADVLGLRQVEVRAVRPFVGSRERHLHVFQKAAATPDGFPRRPGVAARRPLGLD